MTENGAEYQDAKPLIYTEYPVAPSIAKVVQCGWSFAANENLQGAYAHHVLPDGCISLVYRVGNLSFDRMIILSGPRLRELRVDVYAGNRFCGIRFWPDTGGAFLGLDPTTLRDQAVPLGTYAPELANSLKSLLGACTDMERIQARFHEFANSRRVNCLPLDDAVRQAVLLIHQCDGAEPIAQIAEAVGLSPRQLQRRFRARIGLTPKEYARIRRMRSALANAIEEQPRTWASVAANSGYADQAHLSRDAAALTGLTPAGFEARIRPINHQNVDP
jgi:AraC-like DNA-binding protein